MPRNPIVRAAAVQSLPVAQEIMDTVRAAYLAQPGAALISGITLNPLEVLAMNSQSGQSFRVPVTIAPDGGLSFGPPIQPRVSGGTRSLPGPSASRGVSTGDRARIQAAIDRGALPPRRAAFWETKAAAGEDINVIDQLVGGLLPVAGQVAAAAASPEDADYERLFGSAGAQEDGPEYRALYGTVEEGQRVADARNTAARDAAAQTGDQAFERLFGQGGPR